MSLTRKTEKEVPTWGNPFGKYLPARYVFAIFGSFGMAIIYGLKVNLSVTMVAMVNHTATGAYLKNETGGCPPPPGQSVEKPEDGPFVWSAPLQGILLSCYFWGYIISLLPGGHLSETASAKWIMWFAAALNILCTLLTPTMTKVHWGGLLAMRVLEGIGGGVTFPAMHCMIGNWAPPTERSTIANIVYAGCSLGTAISILMAGGLCALIGWESVFYVMGGLSSLWLFIWLFVGNTPASCKFISEEERSMIMTSLGTVGKEKPPPFPLKDVLKSAPFWAILIAHVCSNWGWYMFLIEIPFYMKQVLKFNVAGNAVASALPYFPLLFFSIILAKTLDLLIAKEKITVTCARKTATGIASVIPATCLFSLCFIGCHHTAAIVLMSLGIIACGAMFSGFLGNHIDIAPQYAGTLVAITNTFGTISGIIVPIFVGWVTRGNQDIAAWRIIFFTTIALFSIEFIAFTLMGSGVQQPWAGGRVEGGEETPLKETKGQNNPEKELME